MKEDTDRLLTAAMNHHGISNDEIAGRLFITTRDQKLIVANHCRDGLVIARPVVKEVKAFKERHQLFDDRSVRLKLHAAPENDNSIIDQVVGIWSEIAHETNCHVHLYHHTRKTGGAPITIDDVRGAKRDCRGRPICPNPQCHDG